jgi:FixJ family two-component response regulator
MKAPNLNLYIVDDDKDVRETLAMLFIARHYRVQAFESGESFLANADLQSCGCVLLDIKMDPGMSGLLVFDELHALKSPLLVILLSAYLNVPTASNYTRKGAFDCIEKGNDESLLIERVKQAMDAAKSLSEIAQTKKEALKLWGTLTPSEKEVARVDRRGMQNKLIADELDKSRRTVETQKSSLYKKLEIENPTELDRFMRENDIE